MLKFLNFKKQKRSGFSLLEVLVAITVLTVGLVGVVGLINYNISIARVSPEKVIAVNLAQEGIEVVRNIRDSNWLAGNAFDEDMEGDKVYVLEVSNANGLPSDGYELRDGGVNNIDIDKYQVFYDTVDGFYGQKAPPGLRPADWEIPASDIHRLIEITEIDTYHLKVESNVKWYDRSGNSHTVTLEDHLYDYTLPENNPPIRYYWEGMAKNDVVRCNLAPYNGYTTAPCDTGNSRECWNLSSRPAFGGDPDHLKDRFDWLTVYGWHIYPGMPDCWSDGTNCCEIFTKTQY